MTNLENLRKQAKQLQRWHREGHYPVAARIRAGLPGFATATDREILATAFPLTQAQDLIAGEHGFSSWQALRSHWSDMPTSPTSTDPHLLGAYPQLLTTDFPAARQFYLDQLGFTLIYEYGQPPFYGLISRGDARLNLRWVHQYPADPHIIATEDVLTAYLPVCGVKALFLEYRDRGLDLTQPLTKQPWGVQDFVITDPDGNRLCFTEAIDGR